MVQVAAADEPRLLPSDELADGWMQLFDGHSLFGWHATSDADWQAVDGELRVASGEPGFLMTTTAFADYALHVEFKIPAATNSGIFLHTPLDPRDPAGDCYELNIAPPDNPFPTGSLVGRHKWIPKSPPPTFADRNWHAFEVAVVGGNVQVHVDGRLAQDYVDPAPLSRGYIGLQFREGPISFRNIRLRPLGLEPMFNGQNLDGWNTDLAEESEFEVTPAGELRVLDGRGQLESVGKYADFVFQLECRVDGDGLNSGIFFRCVPRQLMNGYESQIHNAFHGGDPTRPVDCGTGGIFRRQDARRVVSRDHQWFTKTIVADGPHMAVWVNGYQVSDWTDTREPDRNPRRGLRTKRGTLCIQGHDPTTDLRFRNLRILELPKRALPK